MTAQQFTQYLKLYNFPDDIGFVNDFEGDKTIDEWVEYTITTLQQLNQDLDQTEDEEIIENNNETCRRLLPFKTQPNEHFRVCAHCLQALISREPVKYVRIDSIYNEYMLCNWCEEFGFDELFEII